MAIRVRKACRSSSHASHASPSSLIPGSGCFGDVFGHRIQRPAQGVIGQIDALARENAGEERRDVLLNRPLHRVGHHPAPPWPAEAPHSSLSEPGAHSKQLGKEGEIQRLPQKAHAG